MARRGTPEGEAAILASFERVLLRMKANIIRKLQAEGRRIHAEMASAFEGERYADEGGKVHQIKSYGGAWGDYKSEHGLDLRRGHARIGIAKAVKSKAGFIPTPSGFRVDYKIAAAGIVTREKASERSKRRRAWAKGPMFGKGSRNTKRGRLHTFLVSAYIRHFEQAKAPGLGSLSREQRQRLETIARVESEKHLRNLSQSVSRLGRRTQAKVALRLQELGLTIT